MAFTRKFLKALGLTEEQVDSVVEAHTETVDGLKSQMAGYKADAEKLEGVQKELSDLKAKDGGEDYKSKYDSEHAAFEKYKNDQNAKESAALTERLGMTVKSADLFQFTFGQQALMNAHIDFRADFGIGLRKNVQRMGNCPFGGIFDRHAAVVGAAVGYIVKNIIDRAFGKIRHAVSEFGNGGNVRKRAFRPEISHIERMFECECAGHDFAVNRFEGFVAHGAVIECGHFFEHDFFAFRDINSFHVVPFELADLKDRGIAFIEEFDDSGVRRVDLFAKFI